MMNIRLSMWSQKVTDIMKPGTGLIFMKVGVHAKESLEAIIARKTKEIEEAGYALWGYGGNTCHPQSMVQPFAEDYIAKGGVIYLCMQEIDSHHYAEPLRADEFSPDGRTWQEIPKAINVLGSRYALVIKNLHKEEFELPLSRTRVALGNSLGKLGSRYVSGRVDKACLEVFGEGGDSTTSEKPPVHIKLVAEVSAPYAGYVRNRELATEPFQEKY